MPDLRELVYCLEEVNVEKNLSYALIEDRRDSSGSSEDRVPLSDRSVEETWREE